MKQKLPKPTKNAKRGVWEASRYLDGKKVFIGGFKTKKEAEQAIADHVKRLGINQPGGVTRADVPSHHKVSFRVTDGELATIRKAAKDCKQTVADYCRSLVLSLSGR